MLQRLYADNYKCLVNFSLPLQELSPLLEPNGAGKTSVLDIVFALRRLLGEKAPGGHGSAEQFVRERFPEELEEQPGRPLAPRRYVRPPW